METKKIPLFGPVYKNAGESSLNAQNTAIYDAYIDYQIDGMATLNRRPGLDQFYDLNTNQPIDGVYYWQDRGIFVAVSNGQVFTVSPSGVVVDQTSATLNIGQPVFFASTGTQLFMCNGGRLVYFDGSSATSYVADVDAPTTCQSVVYLDGYLLVNVTGSNQINWADFRHPTTWTGSSFANTEADPDRVYRIMKKDRELYVVGERTIEVWENDGETPFSRTPGGARDVGSCAGWSAVLGDNEIMWLSDKRKFVRYAGQDIEPISTPYDKEIQSLDVVWDCRGERLDIAGIQFYVFSFPTANRTLVYNKTHDHWTEWGKWNPATTSYDRFLGNCYAYNPDNNQHVWGSRVDGRLYFMSPDYQTDSGAIIRTSLLSGHISHNVLKQKRTECIRFRAQRGATGASNPKLMIRWLTNKRYWSNEHEMSLGSEGETDLVLRLHRTGIYRTRQYELSATDSVPITIAEAEEDITVLRS